ncbi:MAG: hypothetical protein ACODAU_11555 [Myxococcota bacterium]
MDQQYVWDDVNNLKVVGDQRDPGVLPSGFRPAQKSIEHDALYRVVNVHYQYQGSGAPDDTAEDWRDQRTRPNLDGKTHEQADPMRERPAGMLPTMPATRVRDLTYTYDWLANMTDWQDDQGSFYSQPTRPRCSWV